MIPNSTNSFFMAGPPVSSAASATRYRATRRLCIGETLAFRRNIHDSRGSLRDDLGRPELAAEAPHRRRVGAAHAPQIRLGVVFQQAEPGVFPGALVKHPQPPFVRQG